MTIAEQLKASQAETAALKALLAQEKANKPSGMVKATEKGGVSVYGLGRFPVTLYPSQWEQLFSRQESIKEFIIANAPKLAANAAATKAAAQ